MPNGEFYHLCAELNAFLCCFSGLESVSLMRASDMIFPFYIGKLGLKNKRRLKSLLVFPRVGAPLLLLTFTGLSGARGPASSWTHIRFSSSLATPHHFPICLSVMFSYDQEVGLSLIYCRHFGKTLVMLLPGMMALVAIVSVTLINFLVQLLSVSSYIEIVFCGDRTLVFTGLRWIPHMLLLLSYSSSSVISSSSPQLYELDGDPKRKEFLDDLFSFMQKRGM